MESNPEGGPPNADLYKEIIKDLEVHSRGVDQVRRELKSELTPDMTPPDILETAVAGAKGVPLNPIDSLPQDKKTPDIRMMINVYSRLESTRSLLTTEDKAILGDYARKYGRYRIQVLEAHLLQAREEQPQNALTLKQEYSETGKQLYEIEKQAINEEAMKMASQDVHRAYVDLIEGQATARLRKIGKNLDPLLYDPTIERVTEGDIRAAAYQYDLIVNSLFPTSSQTKA